VVELARDVPQHLTADGIQLAVGAEEPHHALGLLKGLDHGIEQQAVEAAVVSALALPAERWRSPAAAGNSFPGPRVTSWPRSGGALS
jgi:hypothetical protein